MSKIAKVHAYADMFPAGQKISAAIVEYDAPVSPASVSADCFAAEGRTITGARVCNAPDPAMKNGTGRYVILDLAVPGKEGDVVDEGVRDRQGPPPPKVRNTPCVRVRQTKAIAAADGTKLPADKTWTASSDAIEPVVDRFRIGEADGLKYYLYVPEGIAENERYPLVLFIADMGANGSYDRLALSQGIGGTVWATPGEQAKHKCFVLVPQFPFMQVMRDDGTFDPIFHKLKPLLDDVCGDYPVDRDRLYATGQSQGCMAICELNCEYPDLFAGCILVAGQWDAARMAARCVGQRYWILTSEADEKATKGMTEATEAMRAKGATVADFTVDARATEAQLAQEIAAEAGADADIRFTRFAGDSVIPGWDDGPTRLHHAHSHTWPVAYRLEGVRDWLFTCVRKERRHGG